MFERDVEIAQILLGATALDRGADAIGDFADKVEIGLGPVTRFSRVDVQDGYRPVALDDRDIDEGPRAAGRQRLNGLSGARISGGVSDGDKSSAFEVVDEAAEIAQIQHPGKAVDARRRPITFDGKAVIFHIDRAIADAADLEGFAQDLRGGKGDIGNIVEIADGIGQADHRLEPSFDQGALGHVGAFDEDAGDLAGLVHQRLINEIEIARRFGPAIGPVWRKRGAKRAIGHARIEHLVEQVAIALGDGFRQGFGQGHAGDVAAADQLAIARIGHQVAMLWPIKQGHEGRRLFEQLAEAFGIGALGALGLHLRRRFDHGIDDAEHGARFVAHRGIAEGEIGFFGLAVAIDLDQPVLEEGRLAGHGLRGDRRDVFPDLRPDVAHGQAEALGLVAVQRPVGVVIKRQQIRPEKQACRELRRQCHIDSDLKRARPGRDGTDRGGRPVVATH